MTQSAGITMATDARKEITALQARPDLDDECPRQLEPEQFTEIKHFRSAEEFDFAIDKLKRRLSEIEALKKACLKAINE